jgi:hypothetical protein
MSWWRECQHKWVEIDRVKLPSLGITKLNGTNMDLFREIVESMYERTSILLRCQRCGDLRNTTIRGWFPKTEIVAAVEKSQAPQAEKQSEAK